MDILTEEHFFDLLLKYFRKHNVDIEHKRSYPENNYAVIGHKDAFNNYIILHYFKPLGDVNVFGVQFNARKEQRVKELHKEYANLICGFLAETFQNRSNGYLLVRKCVNQGDVVFNNKSRDVFASVLKNNHFPNSFPERHLIYPGAGIKNKIKWAYVSKHNNAVEKLDLLNSFYDNARNLVMNNEVNSIKGCRTLDWNSNNLLNMTISYKQFLVSLKIIPNDLYQISLVIEKTSKEEGKYVPMQLILEPRIDLLTLMNELIELNKMAILFKDNI